MFVKFKWDIAVTLSVWDHWCDWAVGNTYCSLIGLANLYAWEGNHAVGDVLCCKGSRKNSKHISWIIERTDLEREKSAWPRWWVGRGCSTAFSFKPSIERRVPTISIANTLSVTHTLISWPLWASVLQCAASVVMLSIILEDAILQNHILFCLSV